MASTTQAKYGYVRRVLGHGGVFSLPICESVINEAGDHESEISDSFFQVVSTSSDSRLKLVPTVVVSPDEEARASRNAVQIQYLDVHHRDADDCVTCFFRQTPNG
jgi:hypothetical protein